MEIIKLCMFSDNELGDLEKLILVLENLPDKKLMKALNERWEKGGAGYSNASLWDSQQNSYSNTKQ